MRSAGLLSMVVLSGAPWSGLRPGRQLEDSSQLALLASPGEAAGGEIEGPAALSGGLAFYKQ